MKKKTKTFAERAKLILNKYKRRLGENFDKNDPISKASMEAELEALKEEQEIYREEQGFNQEEEQPSFRSGGDLPKLQGGARTQDINKINPISPRIDPYYASNEEQMGLEPWMFDEDAFMLEQEGITPRISTPEVDMSLRTKGAGASPKQELYSPEFPWVGAGATVASNLYNLLSTKSPEKITPQTVRAEEINLGSQRADARRRASRMSSMVGREARGRSTSSADYMNRYIAGITAANRAAGEEISRSRLAEESTNAGARNRANVFNARAKQQAEMQNIAADREYEAGRQSSITGMGRGVSQAYTDWQKQKDLYRALQMQSPYYSIYEDETGRPSIRYNTNKTRG